MYTPRVRGADNPPTETKGAEMRNAKKSEEIAANLALFRLASREMEGVAASCEMFFSHANFPDRGTKMERLWNQFAEIQEKADKIRAKLDRDLEPFAEIEIQEIY
jgi:hypothetical protein